MIMYNFFTRNSMVTSILDADSTFETFLWCLFAAGFKIAF